MTLSQQILKGMTKGGRVLLTGFLALVFGAILFWRPLKRVANAGFVLVTWFLIFIFLVGELSLPLPDTLQRGLWVFLLLGLEEFLKASWKPPRQFESAFTAGKWWFIILAGVFFVLMGITGAFVVALVLSLSLGLLTLFAVIAAVLLLQGGRMIRWAWKHPPGTEAQRW